LALSCIQSSWCVTNRRIDSTSQFWDFVNVPQWIRLSISSALRILLPIYQDVSLYESLWTCPNWPFRSSQNLTITRRSWLRPSLRSHAPCNRAGRHLSTCQTPRADLGFRSGYNVHPPFLLPWLPMRSNCCLLTSCLEIREDEKCARLFFGQIIFRIRLRV
jgi:hypothetical protein